MLHLNPSWIDMYTMKQEFSAGNCNNLGDICAFWKGNCTYKFTVSCINISHICMNMYIRIRCIGLNLYMHCAY